MQKIKERLTAHYRGMTAVGRQSVLATAIIAVLLLTLSASLTAFSAVAGSFAVMSALISEIALCALRCAAAGFLSAFIGDLLLRSR